MLLQVLKICLLKTIPIFPTAFIYWVNIHKLYNSFFTDKIRHFFESNPYYHIKFNGEDLLVFGRE